MNERIRELFDQTLEQFNEEHKDAPYRAMFIVPDPVKEKFAELIVQEYVSEYNKLINGEAVVLPKDREHAEALVRVGMFYLENNK
jgi:hypothetical protein